MTNPNNNNNDDGNDTNNTNDDVVAGSGGGLRVELRISYEQSKLARLYMAKNLFEQDSGHPVDMDVFIDMLVETFLSYRNIRGASESQLLQKIATKKE